MISAVILTKNEERNIEDCLESVAWCDEILVIDDYSEDETLKKIHPDSLGTKLKIYRRRLDNDFAAQRNFGLEKTRGDWVLFVDADERVSPELKDEIQRRTTPGVGKTELMGFYIKRKDFFGGRWLRFGETANVKLLRLARRGAGRWERAVHETWRIKGDIGLLDNPLFHYPHPTISDFAHHINTFSTFHAQVLLKEGKRTNLIQIIAYPLAKFIQNYFFRLGFLDGIPGLIVAVMMSFHSFLARAKLYLLCKK